MIHLFFCKYIKNLNIVSRGLEWSTMTRSSDNATLSDTGYYISRIPIRSQDVNLTTNIIKIYFGQRDAYNNWSVSNYGYSYSIKTVLLNVSKLDNDNLGRLCALDSDRANFGNTALEQLDLTIPMAFTRANTVVNFGRL